MTMSKPLDEQPIQTMSVKDFRELGYLQELNRMFLHPCGLALSVKLLDDGTEEFGIIWDYRDDPEGIVFGPDMIDETKRNNVAEERVRHVSERVARFGYVVQPWK